VYLTALFLAGLSLFFTGINGVKSKLQRLSSRKFRQVLARVTDRPVLAGAVGVVFGAVTQSASAVAFILSGMVATGLITLRRALPVVAASNVGTAVLVFLAAVDMRVAVLAVIGITGLMINFRIASRLEALLGAFFAIGLLFLGLDMMKNAFAPLSGYPWFLAMTSFLKTWVWAPFLLGAALRMIIQSSSAIGVIAIALQSAGLFTELQAVLLICGAGPGVALAGFFLSGTLEGPPRQIVLFQGLINLMSGTVFAVLFALSDLFGHRFLFQFVDAMAVDSSDRIAWAFFLNMSGCLAAGLVAAPFAERLLQRLAPETEAQDLSRTAFLHDEALQVPEAAVSLVDKEQQRFFSLAERAVHTLCADCPKDDALETKTFHSVATSLGNEIGSFLRELIKCELTNTAATSILLYERRQENLMSLAETVSQFATTRRTQTENLEGLFGNITESLHLILLTAQDAWRSRDAEDIALLLVLTSDRSELMERIRQTQVVANLDQKSALFYATTLFERMVWIVRQLGLSLQREE
jgi:phosphate:Na+ symporter